MTKDNKTDLRMGKVKKELLVKPQLNMSDDTEVSDILLAPLDEIKKNTANKDKKENK